MEHLLADKGYDSDAIVAKVEEQGAKAVIPPRKNRKQPREYDKHLYKLRHLVENAFLHLKRWGGSPPVMRKTCHPSWLPYKFAVLPFGWLSRDDST